LRYLYNLLFYIAIPFIVLRLLWKSRKAPAYRARMAERFGRFTVPPEMQNGIWFHCVSVGETIVALPLIKALQKQYPNLPITLTTTTPTGSQTAKNALNNTVFHVYGPYDLPCSLNRFLNKTKPKMLIIMETEIWPNLLHYCHKRSIPILLANARLSARSAGGYARFRKFTKKMLQNFTAVAAQAEPDAWRFKNLGVPKERITITGSIKFDITVPASAKEGGELLRQEFGADRPIWIAASTHNGEDEIILDAHKKIKAIIPSSLLILVPRHPERANQIAGLCKKRNLKTARRSKHESYTVDTDVFIGDTLGEMLLFFAAADIAFIGGSLIQHGGHNMLEPAALGLPVISGKYTFNFAQITKLLQKANALTLVATVDELAGDVISFIEDSKKRQAYGERAKQVAAKNKGALQKHLKIIKEILEI
jgi:3-deoxy-D-manno-octulosonic-acid transferase